MASEALTIERAQTHGVLFVVDFDGMLLGECSVNRKRCWTFAPTRSADDVEQTPRSARCIIQQRSQSVGSEHSQQIPNSRAACSMNCWPKDVPPRPTNDTEGGEHG